MHKKGGSVGCGFLALVIVLLLIIAIPIVMIYGLGPRNILGGSLLDRIDLRKFMPLSIQDEEKGEEYIYIEFNTGQGLPKNTIEAIDQWAAKSEGLSPAEIDQKEKSIKVELGRKYKDTKRELEKRTGSRETEALNKYELGNYTLAEALFVEELAQKKMPDLSAYHLGNIKSLELDFMRAAFYYNQAVTLFPSNIKYLYSVGDAWKELGNLGDALDYYQRAYTASRLRLGENHEATIEIKNMLEEVKAKLPPSQADIYKKLAGTP